MATPLTIRCRPIHQPGSTQSGFKVSDGFGPAAPAADGREVAGAEPAAALQTVSVTDFKARCLDLLTKVYSGELDEVAITKRGHVVARLLPPIPTAGAVAALSGCMAGSVNMAADFDFTAPVFDGAVNAADGIVHE